MEISTVSPFHSKVKYMAAIGNIASSLLIDGNPTESEMIDALHWVGVHEIPNDNAFFGKVAVNSDAILLQMALSESGREVQSLIVFCSSYADINELVIKSQKSIKPLTPFKVALTYDEETPVYFPIADIWNAAKNIAFQSAKIDWDILTLNRLMLIGHAAQCIADSKPIAKNIIKELFRNAARGYLYIDFPDSEYAKIEPFKRQYQCTPLEALIRISYSQIPDLVPIVLLANACGYNYDVLWK